MSTLLARWRLPGLVEPVRPMHTFALWLTRHQQEGRSLWIEAHRDTRTQAQNAKFHALCGDLEKSALTWNGRRRALAEWKFLLVSGHAHVTATEGEGLGELGIGLEGEMVYLRESTAKMGVERSNSLMAYALAFCAMQGVELSDPAEALTQGLQGLQHPPLLLGGLSHA